MTTETENTKSPKRPTPELVDDRIADIIEALGYVAYQISRKDAKAWLTPERAGGIQTSLNEVAQQLHSLSVSVEKFQPRQSLSFSAGGEMPSQPSGMLKRALEAEAQQRPGE